MLTTGPRVRRLTVANQWAGQLLLGPAPGLAMYTGPGGHSDRHAHHAVQLAVAIDEPMQVTIGTKSLTTTAALIPPDVPHSFVVNGRVTFLWTDPHGPRGRRLQEQATRYVENGAATELDGLREVATTAGDSTQLARRLLEAIGEDTDAVAQPSRAVTAALHYLETTMPLDGAAAHPPRLDDAARAAAISPSRLTHVFAEELGIPFRRYVLWVRLLRAVRAIAAGNDLTRAASAAGFSDSAHLSRAFRGIFGLPPSTLLAVELISDGW